MYELAKTISSLQSDFIASSIRSQLGTLQNILNDIENSQRVEDVYVEGSLRRVEKELCRLRRFFSSN